MRKLFVVLVTLTLIAFSAPVGAVTDGGFPNQIYAFSPPPAQYVVIGDLLGVECLIFEADLVTPLPIFSTHERDKADGTTVLQPRIQWLVKGSKVKVYRISDSQASALAVSGFSLPPKPDFDMANRIFMEFCLKIAPVPKPKDEESIQDFKYSFFAGTIQSDRNEKPGWENYRFLGLGGALSRPYPLTFTAGGYVVDTITHHDIRACSEFRQEACATGWDGIPHETRAECDGCRGLDKEVLVKVGEECDEWNYGSPIAGKCPGYENQGTGHYGNPPCYQYPWLNSWKHKFATTCDDWDPVYEKRWEWPNIIVYNQACTAYNGEIIGGYDTYTWKWQTVDDNNVQISELCNNAYMTVSGSGIILYGMHFEKPPLHLEWNDPTTKIWGRIRGVIPGNYTFTIPFLTKGRAPVKEYWAD